LDEQHHKIEKEKHFFLWTKKFPQKKHCRGLLQMTAVKVKLRSGSYGSSLGSHISVRNIDAGVVLLVPQVHRGGFPKLIKV
jgi:hypothetical protein